MPAPTWRKLLAGADRFEPGSYPLPAYSEFMPAPRVACKPYGTTILSPLIDSDPYGWQVTEYEELLEIRPGLAHIADELTRALIRLDRGEASSGLSRHKLDGNPYWPDELAAAPALAHERYVLLLPLALSRTQDDKGRIRWTLFGSSEQGPARAFWRSFYSAPNQEMNQATAIDFFCRLLREAYGAEARSGPDLKRAGFRIHDSSSIKNESDSKLCSFWREKKLPGWTAPLLWKPGQSLRGVRFLLTFEPFHGLPAPIRRSYLAGDLHLLPFPGSLLFWGAQPYWKLARQLPLAVQISLQVMFRRHDAPRGLRIPQSGWMHEPRPDRPGPDDPNLPVRNTYKRTHRWARVHRDEDELAVTAREDKVAHVLFSTEPGDMGLYDKPMARNAQIWTHEMKLLLDGPSAGRTQLKKAEVALRGGGLFGYRFQFPPMRVGRYDVYWQRPLVAFTSPGAQSPSVMHDGITGYLTAYRVGQAKPQSRLKIESPVELWPRITVPPADQSTVQLFEHAPDERPHRTTINARKLLDSWQLAGDGRLPESLAQQLLTLPKHASLDQWLDSLSQRAFDARAGAALATRLRDCTLGVGTGESGQTKPIEALTFGATATRRFETAYWNLIRKLAEGRYRNKVNSDCSHDPATRKVQKRKKRDLEALGDYLLDYYTQLAASREMTDEVLIGDLPFRWETDFDYPWWGGWRRNQEGETCERDLIVVIPGRDRRRAVIMADHYDTAYMEDEYGYGTGGHGPRLAAHGADDNHSATATLMLGARSFLELSRAGKLACDIWLVHLTGEEFPADCMGARHLTRCLVEGSLKMRLHQPAGGRQRFRDLSKTRVQGVYVLDMVAHNNDRDRDIFQMAPGTSRESLWLAWQSHLAARLWNEQAPIWNRSQSRAGKGRGCRSADGKLIPGIAEHPLLSGEVRPAYDPRSTLFNTDGQIFSDAGIPVVLFMENYDINRHGYHDSHDTMENIDLDYGSAVAAIAIESVARAASRDPAFPLVE